MKYFKLTAVIVGAVVITALGIDASDTLRGSSGTMLGQLIGGESGPCPDGMVYVETALTFSCVDQYEASWNEACNIDSVSNQQETGRALEEAGCAATSKPDVIPWSYITREQAVLACSKAKKRLPSAKEWYEVAIGTPDSPESCLLDSSGLGETGALSECVSSAGIYDAVGNVWEWVSDDVIAGEINGRILPEKGYVTQVDSGGIATVTGDTPGELFGEDYFWADQSGAYGVLRGGYHNSKSDGGVYAFHARTLPTAAIGSIGFRCVK